MGLKFALLKAERDILPIGTLHVTLTLKYAFRMIIDVAKLEARALRNKENGPNLSP